MNVIKKEKKPLVYDIMEWLKQLTLLGFVSATLTVIGCSIVALIFMDPIIGIAGLNPMAGELSAAISFGGTAANMAALGVFLVLARQKKWTWALLLLVPLLGINLADVYFDAISADVLRYGQYVTLSSLPAAEQVPLAVMRIFLGLISTFGEFIAPYAMLTHKEVIGMIKDVVGQALNQGLHASV